MIREMGNKHIQALHVHDNDYLSDAHLEPFSGKMDWIAMTKALKDIGYKGDFTFIHTIENINKTEFIALIKLIIIIRIFKG